MALPKILPLSKTVHLPIADIDVKVYAFTVKEEKTLLISRDFGDLSLEENLIDLIRLKTEGVNIDDLCMSDMIILLVEILSISKTSTQDLSFRCSNEVDGKPCNTRIDLKLDIANYNINGTSENHKMVQLDDNTTVELVYPKYRVIAPIRKKEQPTEEDISNIYIDCIYAIYSGDDMITDFTKEEITEWFNDLPGEYLHYFVDFVQSMPSVTLSYDVVCPKCGNKRHFEAVNILDFFTPDTAE